MRHGSAVDISRLTSRTFLAWWGLQTSKIRPSRESTTPFSASLALRSCTPSTPNLWRATASSKSFATRSSGLRDSTMCSMDRLLSVLGHVVEQRHGHAGQQGRGYLARHERERQPLEDRVEQDHRGAHYDRGGGEQHRSEADGTRVHDRLLQRHAPGAA